MKARAVRVHPKESDLLKTDRFKSVVVAADARDRAQRAVCELMRAREALIDATAKAEATLKELEPVLGDKLAMHALGQVSESDVDKIRARMQAASRTIREAPLGLPPLESMLAAEKKNLHRAERVLALFDQYAQAKPLLAAEPRGDTPAFLRLKKLMESISVELGEDAEQDYADFMAGLKRIRPPSFWV